MKQIDSYEVLTGILSNKNSCTFTDLVDYKMNEEAKNPDLYVDVTRKHVLSAITTHPQSFYWDSETGTIFKQESIKCFVCDEVHYMFPDVQKFLKLKESIERIKNKLCNF